MRYLCHALLLLALLALPASAHAQSSLAVQLSGRAELSFFVPADSPAWLIRSTRPFVAPRLSLNGELFLRRLYGFVEVRADRGEAPEDQPMQVRVEQAFARIGLARALAWQTGRFISPFGNYPQRSHTSADPFIRPPVNYDYHTTISRVNIPRDVARFLEWKDEPQTFRRVGAPIVWAVPYQLGSSAILSTHGIDARVAVMSSAPSSLPEAWTRLDNFGPSFVAHATVQIVPELQVGASFNRGPYLDPAVEPLYDAAGFDPSDFIQQVIGFELTATRGLVELRGELLFDRWQLARVSPDPRERSFYIEGKWKVLPGLAAAGRYGRIDFSQVQNKPWDYDIERWQVGLVYQITRKLDVRAEYMLNHGGTVDPRDNLFGFQTAFVF